MISPNSASSLARWAPTRRGSNHDPPKSIDRLRLAKISAKLGRSVHFDPKTERFVNDPEANRKLTRPLRAPWRL